MSAEKILTLMLRVNAAILIVALPMAILPFETMSWIHGWFNMGDLSDQPITEYLARSCSLLYGMHGLVLMLISIAPRRHWSLIGPVALIHVGLGLTIFLVDLDAGMPWYWTAAEGIPISIYGALLYLFWRKAS